jgi:anti-sigma regulatory factor (Ser/Thr protein kinase)/CBS domain-containing protein
MKILSLQDQRKEDIGKTQELIYELKSESVMQSKLVVVGPDTPVMKIKNLLLKNRITGVPIVEGDTLLGFVSIVEVIHCLEKGDSDSLARDKMARPPFPSVYMDESVAHALNQLSKFNARRVFVFDHQEKLAGILTSGDIITGLLKALNLSFRQEEISRYRASHIFQDIESDETSLVMRYKVVAGDFTHGGEASSKIKKALQRLGANPQDVRRIAIAVYEAEMNVIIHTTRGGSIETGITPQKLVFTVMDDGPGIPDIEQAMQTGYSTAPLTIKALGFGAGMGLKNIKRCMDEMILESEVGEGPGKGTTLTMVLYPT